MSVFQKVKSIIKGDDVPQPIAGLMDPIDTERLSAELKLVVRGEENGNQERPASANTTPDAVEGEIVGAIMAEWSLQRDHLIAMLRAYRDRLSELTTASEIGQLRVTKDHAVAKIKQRRQEARGDLARLSAAYVAARDELADFRKRHRLSWSARNPSGRWTTIGLLFVMVGLESVMNGLFFAKGSERGLIGGIGIAFGISAANVIFCFMLGLVPARFVNWRRWFVRILATLVTLAGLAAVLLLHLLAGHIRDATVAAGEPLAFATALAKMVSTPWQLADMTSWYLFGVGTLFGLVSFWKGYRYDDPYPFYGELYRRERDAAERYSDKHHEFFGELEDVRDEAVKTFEDGIANIPEYAAKSQQIRAARSALLEKFRGYEQLIAQAANQLLRTYRDANLKRRKTPEPAYFVSGWTLPGSAVAGSDIVALATDAPDSVITNVDATLAELNALSQEVIHTYTELMDAFEHPSDMK